MALVFSSDSILLVVVLVTSCWCAPTQEAEWWFNPCGADLPKLRHSRSTDNPVQAQFKIFILKLEDSLRKINKLYSPKQGKAPVPKNSHMKGLKIKNMLQAIKKAQTHDKKYEKLHKALLQFAGTLEVLRNVQINSHEANFDKRERSKIYNNIAYEIRALLCEVQDVPKIADIKRVPLKGLPSFKKPLDVTFAQLIDTAFLKKTKSFAKKAVRLLKVKKNKSGAVKSNKRTSKIKLRQP